MQPHHLSAATAGHGRRFAWLGAALAATLAIAIFSAPAAPAAPSRTGDPTLQTRMYRCGGAKRVRWTEADAARHYQREAARAQRRAVHEAEHRLAEAERAAARAEREAARAAAHAERAAARAE